MAGPGPGRRSARLPGAAGDRRRGTRGRTTAPDRPRRPCAPPL